MILITITGGKGSGKTTALLDASKWAIEQGLETDGLVSIAGRRPTPGKGADTYSIHWLKSGKKTLFLERDESLSPPYQEHPGFEADRDNWMAFYSRSAPPDIVFLDEIGPFELEGKGHLTVLELIRSHPPKVLVLSIAERVYDEVLTRFRLTPDLELSAYESDTPHRLIRFLKNPGDWTTVGVWGATGGAIETTAGSLLHGLHIPFRGFFLSTLQSVLLSAAGDSLEKKTRLAWVAVLTSGLKSLSPSGQRIRPMLAITMQGILFSLAVLTVGWNWFAIAIGSFLVGCWSAAQGLLLQWLFTGPGFSVTLDAGVNWVADQAGIRELPSWPVLLMGLILSFGVVSMVLSLLFTVLRRRARFDLVAWLTQKPFIRRKHSSAPPASVTSRILRELASAAFWGPVLIIAAVTWLINHDWTMTGWILLQAATALILLSSLVSLVKFNRIEGWMRARKWDGPAVALRRLLHSNHPSDER